MGEWWPWIISNGCGLTPSNLVTVIFSWLAIKPVAVISILFV
jgi:hypothetical protein